MRRFILDILCFEEVDNSSSSFLFKVISNSKRITQMHENPVKRIPVYMFYFIFCFRICTQRHSTVNPVELDLLDPNLP
jgi:hypothetical protein